MRIEGSSLTRKSDSKVGVVAGVALLAFWTLLGTFGYMSIEGWTFADSLYMTLITLSTVGFGEVHALSQTGRLFTAFIIIVGLATTVYTFTRLGQLVFEGEIKDIFERRSMKKEIAKLDGHFIVCGFGRVGQHVVEGLKDADSKFCVIDMDQDKEPELRDAGILYLIGDVNNDDVLREAGIERATQLLALLPSDADNLYLSILAKELNPKLKVVARATDHKSQKRLLRSGADKVISHYQIASQRILNAVLHPTITEFIDLWTDRKRVEVEMEEFSVPEGAGIVGSSLAESKIRDCHRH